MAYFALSKYYRPLPELDEWIRRRVSASWRMHPQTVAQMPDVYTQSGQARCSRDSGDKRWQKQ